MYPANKKKVTAAQMFEYLNGFAPPKSGERLPPGFEAKGGLSFGSLSAYQSLYEAMHAETQELYFALDNQLSVPDVIGQQPQQLWHRVMWPLPFPEQEMWPTNNSTMFPAHWLYRHTQFHRNQSVAAQQVFLRRLLYAWFYKVSMVRNKGFGKVVATMLTQTPIILEFVELLDLWRAADRLDQEQEAAAAEATSLKQLSGDPEQMDQKKGDDDNDEGDDTGPDPELTPETKWDFLEDEDFHQEEFAHLTKPFRSQYLPMLVAAWHALLRVPWPEGAKATVGVAEFVNIKHIVTEAKQKYTSAKARLEAAEEAGEEGEKNAALAHLDVCTQDVLSDFEVDLTGNDGEGDAPSEVDPEALTQRVRNHRLRAVASQLLNEEQQVCCGRWQEQFASDQANEKHNAGTCALILIDPWYDKRWPDAGEISRLVEAAKYYGTDDAVVILFFPWQKVGDFIKEFSGAFNCSPYCVRLQRPRNKLGRGGTTGMLKSLSDQYTIFWRKGAERRKMRVDQVTARFGDPSAGGSNAANGGSPWDTDVWEYKPVNQADRLRDDDDNPLRPGAEKTFELYLKLICMYTDLDGKPTSVWDPYGGTMQAGIACMAVGQRYIATEEDVQVYESAKRRLHEYVWGRLDSGGPTVAVATYAVSNGTVPPGEALAIGELAARGLSYLAVARSPKGQEPGLTRKELLENRGNDFEIKLTDQTGKGGRSLGLCLHVADRLFLDDMVPGTSFNPPLCFFGTICADLGGVPRPTGAQGFHSKVMTGLYVIPAASSVARFIASSVGTGKAPNVVITEHDPRSTKEGYRLFEITISRSITTGELLLCDWNKRYLACGHTDLVVDEKNDTPQDIAYKRRQTKASARARKIDWQSPSEAGDDEGEDSTDSEHSSGGEEGEDGDKEYKPEKQGKKAQSSRSGVKGEQTKGKKSKKAKSKNKKAIQKKRKAPESKTVMVVNEEAKKEEQPRCCCCGKVRLCRQTLNPMTTVTCSGR